MKHEIEAMVLDNIALVGHVARRFHNRPDYEDIFQSGVLGLCEAAMRFDKSKGYAFSTYAYPYIDGRISRHYREYAISTLKLPRAVVEQITRGEDVGFQVQSLDFMLDDKTSMSDVVPDALLANDTCLENLEYKLTIEAIEKQLKKIEYQVFIQSLEEVPQRQIAKNLHIAQATVSRALKRARTKLQKNRYLAS